MARPSEQVLPAIAAAVLALVAGLLVVVLAAAPAAAHGRGSDATNYHSQITGTPDIEGVTWRIYGGDEFLEVSNTSDRELLVLGYEDEPYVRVGPEGVFENVNSKATYLNTDRYAQVAPPPTAGADAEPEWRKVSDGPSYAWHDHRIHWMSTDLPPQVADPSVRTQVMEWAVPFEIDGQPFEVTGSLTWVSSPSPWPWLLLAAVATLPALLGLRAGTPDDGGRALIRPAAAVLGVVALLNVLHLVDDLFAVPLPLSTIALAALQTVLFLALGVFGAVRAWRGGDGAFTALGVGSGAVFVGQGLLYLSALTASQTASLSPDELTRFVIAASLVQVLPVGAIAVIGTRRYAPSVDAPAGEGEPATT